MRTDIPLNQKKKKKKNQKYCLLKKKKKKKLKISYQTFSGKPVVEIASSPPSKEFFMIDRKHALTCNVTCNHESHTVVWKWQACNPGNCSTDPDAWSVINETSFERPQNSLCK